MPFIGQQPLTGAYSKLDAITTSATATYNLLLNGGAYSPDSANHLLVSLNGVMQAPQDSFTVSGSTIIFDSALTSSDNIDFIMALGDVLNIGTPSDGTVTAGKIATNAVTDAKIAGMAASKLTGALPALDGSALTGAGKTLGITKFSNNTRTSLSQVDTYDFFDTNVTQVKASSKFLVHVHLIGFADSAGTMNFDLIYDGTTYQGGSTYAYTAQDYPHIISGIYYIDGASSTGAKNFKFRQNMRSATGKPFNIWNPNHTDDARMEQVTSNIIFIEYDL